MAPPPWTGAGGLLRRLIMRETSLRYQIHPPLDHARIFTPRIFTLRIFISSPSHSTDVHRCSVRSLSRTQDARASFTNVSRRHTPTLMPPIRGGFWEDFLAQVSVLTAKLTQFRGEDGDLRTHVTLCMHPCRAVYAPISRLGYATTSI